MHILLVHDEFRILNHYLARNGKMSSSFTFACELRPHNCPEKGETSEVVDGGLKRGRF